MKIKWMHLQEQLKTQSKNFLWNDLECHLLLSYLEQIRIQQKFRIYPYLGELLLICT
jgi:hypothetical protein